jgi:hypothetical protein
MIFKAKRDFAKVLFKGEEYEATKVEGDHATFVIDGVTYGFSISDNFEQEKLVIRNLDPPLTPFGEALKLLRELIDLQKDGLSSIQKIQDVEEFLERFEPKQDLFVQENTDD